jgi:peroxiredoxin
MTQPALAEDPKPALAQETAQAKQQFLASQSPNVQQTVMAAFQRLLSSDVARNAKTVGEPAPDFELPNAQGGSLRLSKALKQGPVVLSFYRGGWCPFCNLELKALRDKLPEMRSLGATLIAVSPQDPEHSRRTASDMGLDFPVLSDQGNRLTRDYGLLMALDPEMRALYQEWGIDLVEANGNDSYELPVPATYVIDYDGIIRAAYVDKDYTRRMEPADIIAALKAL